MPVETTHADESRCDGVALEPNLQTEPLVGVPPLLGRNHEFKLSTRDRPANTGADAWIKEIRGEWGSASCAPTLWKEKQAPVSRCPIVHNMSS